MELPPPVHELVGEYCSTPFGKRLERSDLMNSYNRLRLKTSDVKQYLYPLLNSSQVEEIENRGMTVNVYDGEGNMYEMKFKLWGGKAYALANRWFWFCRDHVLVEKDLITLWMFKHVHIHHQLCFAIRIGEDN